MGVRTRTAILVLAFLLAVGAMGDARAQFHPHDLPPLTGDEEFPRFTPRQLELAGFPDHLHAWTWSGWEPPVGADGEPYGPGAYCRARELVDARDVVITADTVARDRLVLQHHPGYTACDMLPFLGLADMAFRHVGGILGLDVPDTLVMVNTNNVEHYRELTGQGVWRLYQRDGDRAVLQAIGTLQARTLDGHAAYMVVTEWLLDRALPTDLPAWLTQGLVDYFAENGCHLANVMFEFRPRGEILMTPAQASRVLGAGIFPEPSEDRRLYRLARYSSFLAAWELIENQGGLVALRGFLHRVRDGETPDDAARAEWGVDLAGLADLVDPVQLGEPAGVATEPRYPHVEP